MCKKSIGYDFMLLKFPVYIHIKYLLCFYSQGFKAFSSFKLWFLDLSLPLVKTEPALKTIQMVDLVSQNLRLKDEISAAIEKVLTHSIFINGPEVKQFAGELESYLGVKHVIPCGNGTDALQIALMSLDLPKGSEVITAGFSYAAVAEVCLLLGLKPVFADVDNSTFNIDPLEIEKHISPLSKVIIPVHLFGQSCDMETIMAIAEKHNLYVVEDNAQAIGAEYTFSDGSSRKAGCIGHIGTTSFFPSKNLACFGDGGALFTNDANLAGKIRMIANHGQKEKYYHEVIGINSRLDTIQAAVLSVKLKHLDSFIKERKSVAALYNKAFEGITEIKTPERYKKSSHVYHQYTLQLFGTDSAALRDVLKEEGIPSMIYYPVPLYRQPAYKTHAYLPVTEALCKSVLSLPIGTDMEDEQIETIINKVKQNINKQ